MSASTGKRHPLLRCTLSLTKRGDNAAIRKVRYVFPDKWEHCQPDCFTWWWCTMTRAAWGGAVMKAGRFLWEQARAFHSDDALEMPQRCALGLFIHCSLLTTSWFGNSRRRIPYAPLNAVTTFLRVQSYSAALSPAMERFGNSPEHRWQNRRSVNTRNLIGTCC